MNAACGFYGKLPSHGDFIRRGLPDLFVEAWDRWLQRELAEVKYSLDGVPQESYLASPTWRFVLGAGLAGDEVWAGVVIPSTDRVGRRFPFCVAAGLPSAPSVFRCGALAHDWFEHAERIALSAHSGLTGDLDSLRSDVEAGLARLPPVRRMHRVAATTSAAARSVNGGDWRFALPSALALDLGMIDALEQIAHETFGEPSLWWTNGVEGVPPEWYCMRGWPSGLMSTWIDAYRAGQDADPADTITGVDGPAEPSPARCHPSIDSVGGEHRARGPDVHGLSAAAWTDIGKLRSRNEDASLVETASGLWAVADGMGGHSHGDVASRLVVDALAGMPRAKDLQTAIECAQDVLHKANRRLRGMAVDPEYGFESGTTVILLLLRDNHAAVMWVGDSRLYRSRGSRLELLTRDHSTEAEALTDQSASIIDLLSAPAGELTRAVGGADEIEIEVAFLQVQSGDRLLLCTDGLYTEVAEAGVGAALRAATPEQAVKLLAMQFDASEARDNATAIVVSVA